MKTTLLLLSGLLATCARADVKMYSSRAAWLAAAVSSPTTIDFGKDAPVSSGTYRIIQTPPGLTLSGVNFSSTAPGGLISIVSQNYYCATYKRGYDQLASNTNGTGIAITFPSGMFAFGFDLFSVLSGNGNGTNQDAVDVTVLGQVFTIQTPVAPGAVFVGFVSSTAIASSTIVPQQLHGGTEANIMNLSFGASAPTITVVATANPQAAVRALTPASLVTILANGFSFGSTGAAVAVVDSSGQQFDLALLSASPAEVEAVLPDGLATGLAVFTATPTAGGNRFTASANIAAIAPGILTANGTGLGVASALVTTTHADGTVTAAPAHICLSLANCIGLPIPVGDQVVITLYGMGIRGMSSLDAVSVSIGGAAAAVLNAGPQGDYPWLDQVSFQLPGALAGAGGVKVLLTVDGVAANVVTLRVN